MKLYDFDAMFDEKLSDYISKNVGKYKEEEWEDIIPKLYRKFGDTVIKSIGKTPREYYASMESGELIKCLKAHLKNGVPVSEFLCKEIENRDLTAELLPLLDGSEEEREYAVNLIGPDERAIAKYMSMLRECDDEEFKERLADNIKQKADLVLSQALAEYKEGRNAEIMLEIMSRSAVRDDEVFTVLLNAFRGDDDNIPMHASYLAAYGDERALPYLLDKIDEEGITFAEYRELKFAIESLGGEYTKERDFSSDPYYQALKGTSSTDGTDIFSIFDKRS